MMKPLLKISFIMFMVLVGCTGSNYYNLVRELRNRNLEKIGIKLKYHHIPAGMNSKPIINDFHDMLYTMSDDTVDVVAYNTFVMGEFEKNKKYSNLLNPHSKYKDSWFGVYFVIDDPEERGKEFMLYDPQGDPGDLSNIREEAMFAVPHYDQKLIVYSSHQNQKGYTYEIFNEEFFFKIKTSSVNNFTDRKKRNWKRFDGSSNTIAALTDIEKTDMKLLSSIRIYAGLPDKEVYEIVKPWHFITIHGSVIARYFECENVNYWALVYYNGTEFTTNQNKHINTWRDTDIKELFDEAFESLEIGCHN